MSYPVKSPRKLIEVALPLNAINTESLRRKQKAPKGWPTSFHKWWAQRPLAAARAVIFAQLVNDPGYQQGGGFKYGKNKKEAAEERERLFGLIEKLIKWENSTNHEVLEEARSEIWKSWREVCELNRDHPRAAELFDPNELPSLHDPFAGGGTIPLEAQRLGLRAIASDLNPVAVIINKAMMEIPSKFVGRPPISEAQSCERTERSLGLSHDWPNATGLAEDVRYYAAWMREEAQKRIGHLYPPVEITSNMTKERPDLKPFVGQKLAVTAWLWARTVKSPNPAFKHVDVPLASNFILSTKGVGVYVEPVVNGDQYRFRIKVGTPPADARKGTKLARGANFGCLVSGTPIESDYIKAEGVAGRMGVRLMAVVVEGERKRLYLAPTPEQETVAEAAKPAWKPEECIFGSTQYLGVKPYGIENFSQLFTDRQLVGLTTFTDLVQEAFARCKHHAILAGMQDDRTGVDAGGVGATAYAEALVTYLALIVDRMAFYGSSLCGWLPKDNAMGKSMPQQALAMSWDFAEGNFLGKSSSDIITCAKSVTNYLDLATPNSNVVVTQQDARYISNGPKVIFSTDPPYYDNVPYADLSDFFYVWLRRSLKPFFPNLFATIGAPKAGELVAFAYRHETGKAGAEEFFLNGMTEAMKRLAERAHPAFPSTIYYAFKQAETDENAATSSTGWETFLQAVMQAGFAISGTWPMRTEGEARMRAAESNALSSSIILVCRRQPSDALTISRREFLREINGVLPDALDEMTKGAGGEYSPVAPVDLSQAIIGPGMAVFSKYAAVLEADGSPMSVRTALQLINRFLAEDDFDADTQFCLHWFEQYGWTEGVFGEADVLARSKSTSVDAMKEAGVLQSGGGKVRLLKWSEYPTDWDPRTDTRTPVWEALHQLIRALKQGGESASGALLAALGGKAEAARQLAYRLYTLCERLGQAEDARAYNELITSWTGIESAATRLPAPAERQGVLF
jgi:putative DNA methylase